MQSSDIKLSKIQNIGHSYPQPTERHFSLVMKRRTNLTFTKIHSKLAWLNEKKCSMKKKMIKCEQFGYISICLLNRKNCFHIIFIEWQLKKNYGFYSVHLEMFRLFRMFLSSVPI